MKGGKREPGITRMPRRCARRARRSVLDNAFARQAIAECAAAGVQPQWFYVPAFSTIYVELRDMWDSGEAIDLVTFTQRLRDKNLLEAVGGPAEVTALQNYLSNLFNIAPTGANLPHYISIVRDKFALRQTLAAGAELVRRATEDQDNPQAVFDEVESRIASIRSLHGRNGTNDLSIRSPEEILALPIESCYRDRHTKGGSLVMPESAAWKDPVYCNFCVAHHRAHVVRDSNARAWSNLFTVSNGKLNYGLLDDLAH